MSKTEGNLKKALAGESKANRVYHAFAEAAEQEGFPEVAKLFRKHAEEENAHVTAHLKRLGIVKSTRENLETAVAGETDDARDVEFIGIFHRGGAEGAEK
ncbi:MAG: ferritin family protein [bacterium]